MPNKLFQNGVPNWDHGARGPAGGCYMMGQAERAVRSRRQVFAQEGG